MKKLLRTFSVLAAVFFLTFTATTPANAAVYLNSANITHPGAIHYYNAIYAHGGGAVTQSWTYASINCAQNMKFALRYSANGATVTNYLTFGYASTNTMRYTMAGFNSSSIPASQYRMNAQSVATVSAGCATQKTIHWQGYLTTV